MNDENNRETEKELILIVDDVPHNLQVLGNILSEKNYRVAAATSGRQVLEMREDQLPDLILLDVMMPEMDGFLVCRKLKENELTRDIPVIFVTARTAAEDIVEGFQLGAVDYVTKPFNKVELLARVETHLALRKVRKNVIRLEQQNAVLAMAVTASHEISQPLTVLEGNFELFQKSLDEGTLSEKQRMFLTKIEKSIDKVQLLLKKFTTSESIHFEKYIGKKKLVVFD